MAVRSGLQKAIVEKVDLPPLSIFSDGTIGYYTRHRVISVDRNKYSHWSPVIQVRVPPFEYIGSVDCVLNGNSITAIWGDEYNRPRYDVFVRWGNDVQKVHVAGGIATITTHVDHGFSVGEKVEIKNCSVTALNGTFTITATTARGISFPSTAAADNVTQTGCEALTPYIYHGTTTVHSYSFLKLANYDLLHVDVQVETREKIYSAEQLLIYDSPTIHLT